MSTSLIDQMSLVVVDGQPDDYFHLLQTIEDQGACPHFFTQGQDLLENGIPAATVCWLINYDLPDMSGLELCELLRQRVANSTTFIVVDEYDAAAEMEVLVSGLAQFACKPIHPSWIRDGVLWKPAYSRSRTSRRTARMSVAAPRTINTYPHVRRTVA